MAYIFRGYEIRDDMLDALNKYIEHGHPVGDFLTAVLCNDLMEACGRADDENMANLPAYCAFMYNEMPPASFGSRGKVAAWLAKFEAERKAKETA